MLNIGHLLQRRRASSPAASSSASRSAAPWCVTRKAFLMDEPLSNLDAKLRVQMRSELKRFHQDLQRDRPLRDPRPDSKPSPWPTRWRSCTTGIVQQYGSADETVFAHPVNLFVAGFVGSPPMSLIRGKLIHQNGSTAVEGNDGWRYILSDANARRAAASSGEVVVGVRHSRVSISREERPGLLPAKIYTVEPTGDITYVHLRLGDQIIIAGADAAFRGDPDEPLWLDFDPTAIHLFDAATELALPELEPSAPAPSREALLNGA